MAKDINLTRGLAATVDDEDYDAVSKFKWSATFKSRKPYAVRRIHLGPISKYVYAGKMVYLHSMIANPPKGYCVDHINGDTLDCRRSNLRNCRNADNCRNRNRSRSNTSGYKGVTLYKKTGRWRGQIMVNRKNIHLGYFATAAEAATAYNEAAKKYYGEFARLNEL